MALFSPYLLGGTISLYVGFKTYKSYYSNDFEYLIDDEENISQQDLNSEIQEHQEKNENNICNETNQDINDCEDSNIKEIVRKEEKNNILEPLEPLESLKPKQENKITIVVCEEEDVVVEEDVVLEEDKVILDISHGEKNEKTIQEEIINTILQLEEAYVTLVQNYNEGIEYLGERIGDRVDFETSLRRIRKYVKNMHTFARRKIRVYTEL